MRKILSFSLIELLVVIAIIGILSALSVGSYNSSRVRSRDVTRKSNILNIASSLEQYKSTNNVYATQYSASLGVPCQENATWDATGLGDCYWGVNTSFANSDPLFVQDTTSAATKLASAYLLPYMSKPKSSSSTIPSSTGSFYIGKTTGSNTVDFSVDTINYRVQNSYYVVRTVLENRAVACSDGYDSNNSGYLTNDATSPNKWREATYPASGTDCNGSYKIFQKSSLSSLK